MDHRGSEGKGMQGVGWGGGGREKQILNRTIYRQAQKIAGLRTFNNHPNVTCQILFLNILSGRCFSAVISRRENIF